MCYAIEYGRCLLAIYCVLSYFCPAVHSGGPMSFQPRASETYSLRHPEMPQYSTAPPRAQPDATQPPGMPANQSSAYAAPPLPSMQTHTVAPPSPTPAGNSYRVSYATFVHTLSI